MMNAVDHLARIVRTATPMLPRGETRTRLEIQISVRKRIWAELGANPKTPTEAAIRFARMAFARALILGLDPDSAEDAAISEVGMMPPRGEDFDAVRADIRDLVEEILEGVE